MYHNNIKLKKYKPLFFALFIFFVLFSATCLSSCEKQQGGQNLPASSDAATLLNQFNTKLELLQDNIFANKNLEKEISPQLLYNSTTAPFTVFLSLCNTESRATVLCGTGSTLTEAWDNAAATARKYVGDNNFNTIWLKADIVSQCQQIAADLLSGLVYPCYDEMFRKGISLTEDFSTAFLEAEINGNKLIDYDNDVLDLETINKYLTAFSRDTIKELPDKLLIFSCLGWLCDQDNNVYQLYSDNDNYGRRIIDNVDQDYTWQIIDSSANYLADMIQDDGSFIYGYYPTYDRELTDYNILRHIASIWSLLNLYKTEPSAELKTEIDAAVDYAVNGYIDYPDTASAFVVEHKSNEIKLGGNGLAVITLTNYMEVFNTDKYTDLCCKLGAGILSMLDQSTGKYYHVLNYPDYSQKAEYRTVYYDGEATFALCKLYSLTNDKKWLTAAESAVDHFIEADYTQYRDHWVAYSMNEITKYVPSEKYFTFALQNAQNNLDKIYNQSTTWHTYMELLMATFDTYDRIITEGYDIAYLQEFDAKYFINTIFHRAEYMLNGYCYPEYVMYLKVPQHYEGAFFIRHDGYRIRIDDLQHFLGGYFNFYFNYDKLKAYQTSL